MPHDGSHSEPDLDLDDNETARRAPRPARTRRRWARAMAPPESDPDTIRFEPPEWTRGERPRPSMVPALLMLTVLGAVASLAALYLS